jgi:DNA-binding NarL/FixJ family response regulator
MMPPTIAGVGSEPHTSELVKRSMSPTGVWRFSPRERQIVTFLASGCSNQEIADRLGLRLQTVKNHLSRIYRKLGVPNRVQLAVLVVHESQTAATKV